LQVHAAGGADLPSRGAGEHEPRSRGSCSSARAPSSTTFGRRSASSTWSHGRSSRAPSR